MSEAQKAAKAEDAAKKERLAALKAKEPTRENITAELNAIRRRVAERRRQLPMAVPYNSTDLADAEWLIYELDKAMGYTGMTPSEIAELQELEDRRKLSQHFQAVADRIAAKHGALTPDELVERDHLTMLQDQQLGTDLPRYQELASKSEEFKDK